jgi:hypothetical protein
MALVTRSNIPSELRPGLAAVFGDWNTYPDLFKRIYKIHHSSMAVEYDVEMQGLGLGKIKQDGAPVAQGNLQQAYTTSYFHQFYGISVSLSRGMIEDNLYESEFPQIALQLRNSLSTLRNINSMYQFNNAFNEQSQVSNGQPLCSTAQPIATGTLANTFDNQVGLTESAIEEAITLIKQWLSQSGLNINLNPESILVPTRLQFQASRILNSAFRTGTGNNDINAISHGKYLPGGMIVNPFLTNPYNWFIITDESPSFKMYQRSNLDIDFIMDPLTDNTTIRAVERYSFGCSNWRGVFGVQGSSAQ